tara:strand:- start:12451 stop:12666 length:216 start_codon:yes stop_codon:yes gene_type:complete
LDQELIESMLGSMNKNIHAIEKDIATLVYYMNGGLDYNQAWLLTTRQRRVMIKVIEDHYKAMNTSKSQQAF